MSEALERLPKSVKRFSDKRRGESKGLEQGCDSKIAHFALMFKKMGGGVDFYGKPFKKTLLCLE